MKVYLLNKPLVVVNLAPFHHNDNCNNEMENGALHTSR